MTSVRRVLACLGIAAFAMTFGTLTAQDKKKDDKKDEKTPTTKEIMKKFQGKTSVLSSLSTAAKGGKWEDAQKVGKELKSYGEVVAKEKPKKGSDTSWETHTKGFTETMTAIADATEKKDADAVATNIKTFQGSCGGCHKAHKP